MPTATPRSSHLPRGAHLLLTGLLCAFSSLTAAQSPDSPGTLHKLKETGVISLGYRTDSAPFSFTGDNTQPWGYSVELCQEVVTLLRHNLSLPNLRIQWVPVTSATRISAPTFIAPLAVPTAGLYRAPAHAIRHNDVRCGRGTGCRIRRAGTRCCRDGRDRRGACKKRS